MNNKLERCLKVVESTIAGKHYPNYIDKEQVIVSAKVGAWQCWQKKPEFNCAYVAGLRAAIEELRRQSFLSRRMQKKRNTDNVQYMFPLSLDAPVIENGSNLSDLIPDKSFKEREDNFLTSEMLRTYVNWLPTKQRAVIRLYYFGEMSTPEISRKTGWSVSYIQLLKIQGEERLCQYLK